MQDLRGVLLMTLDPQGAVEATGALLGLQADAESYLRGLLEVLLSETESEQLRFLSALYLGQYFRSHASLGDEVGVQLARPLLQRFHMLPRRCRELLVEFLGDAVIQGFQNGSWPESYAEISSILARAQSAFRLAPSEDGLLLVRDAVALLVEPMGAYRYVELDDAVATKLLKILGCTSQPLFDTVWFLVQWYAKAVEAAEVPAIVQALGDGELNLPLASPSGAAAPQISRRILDPADAAIGSAVTAMTSMLTLEDFPQFYIDNFRALSTLCACVLSITGPAVQGSAQELQHFSACRKAAISYFDTLLRAQSQDPLVKKAVEPFLRVLLAFTEFTLSAPALDALAAFSIGKLAELCDPPEYCPLLQARHTEILSSIVLPAIVVSAEDLEKVLEDDSVFTRNFLSGRESLSRRGAAEDLLRALGRQRPDITRECMRLTMEMLGRQQGKALGREFFVTGVQTLSFYRASVSGQFCREMGILGPLRPEAALEQFLPGCVDPMLAVAVSILRQDSPLPSEEGAGPAFLLFCAEAVKFVADFRQFIPAALFPAYLSRIAEIVSLVASSANSEINQSAFLVSVLADSLSALLESPAGCACQRSILASGDSAGAVQRLLWTFLPSSEEAIPSCLLVRGGSGNEFAIAAALSLARYLGPTMTADDVVGLLGLLFSLLVPYCIKKAERAIFLHEVFEYGATLCGVLERKLWPDHPAGQTPGRASGGASPQTASATSPAPLPARFPEVEGSFFALYEVARQADYEDAYQYIFQLSVSFAKISAAAAGKLPQRYLRVLFPFSLRGELYQLAANVPALTMLICTLLDLAAPLGDAFLAMTDPAPDSLDSMTVLAHSGADEIPARLEASEGPGSQGQTFIQRLLGCCSTLLDVSFLAHCAVQIFGTLAVFFPSLRGQGMVQDVLGEIFKRYDSLRANRKFPPVFAGFLGELAVSFGPEATVQTIEGALARAAGSPLQAAGLAGVFRGVFVPGASAVSSRAEISHTITLGLCRLCGAPRVLQDADALGEALRALGISSGHSRTREALVRGSQEEEKRATSSSAFSPLRALRFSFPAGRRHAVSDKEARALAETHARQALQACGTDPRELARFGWVG